jgi:hypothetical protein
VERNLVGLGFGLEELDALDAEAPDSSFLDSTSLTTDLTVFVSTTPVDAPDYMGSSSGSPSETWCTRCKSWSTVSAMRG